MENIVLSRSYLETLPSAELLALADDFGIDIPDNLNRRFIIGELLEAADDMEHGCHSDLKNEEEEVPQPEALPSSYNETQVSVVLKNPAWAFVYWDIRESDLPLLQRSGFVSMYLRVMFFDADGVTKTSSSFDISISVSDRAQYVLLPAGGRFLRIDLVIENKDSGVQVLASSRKIVLPNMSGKFFKPLPDMNVSPVMELSGFKELLRTHYMNHRQSFL